MYIRPSQFFFTNMETSPLLVNGCKFWLVPCSVNVNFSIWVKNSRKGSINNGQTHENTALFSWPWSNKDTLVCHTYCETVVSPMLNFSCRYNFWSSVKRVFSFGTFKANPFFSLLVLILVVWAECFVNETSNFPPSDFCAYNVFDLSDRLSFSS